MKSFIAKLFFAAVTVGPNGVMAQTLPGPLPTDFGALLTPQLEGGSRYRLAVGSDMAYDDNIYRVPGNQSRVVVTPGVSYSNSGRIGRYYAQGNIDLPVSRQRFLGQVTGSVYRFPDHSYLDYEAIDFRGGWLWEVGDSLKGMLRYDHQRGLADFIDVQPVAQNVRTYQNWLGSAEYSVTPRWALTGSVNGYQSKNGDRGYAAGDLRQRTTELGLKYYATGANYVRALYAVTDGRYPSRVQTIDVDDEFEQREIGGEARYQVSEATNFIGRYVRTRREFPDVPRNNQEKPNWRLDFNWGISPKTRLNVNTRREYGIFEFVDLTSPTRILSAPSLNTIYGVAPSWDIVPTVRLELSYERWRRELPGLTATRTDRLEFLRLSARWNPNRNWLARVGVLQSSRDSTAKDVNGISLNFTDRVVYGTVEYRF